MDASSSSSLVRPGHASIALTVDKLPTVVFHEILSHFTYEELSSLRLVNQFFKRVVEKRLNDSFFRLGRELNELSLMLKRKLPRKESERKEHPMNCYVDITSALETRHALLSMSYKKYMDAGVCCFIPGKVLDLCFNALNMVKDYVNRNVYVQLSPLAIMKDIRDYSTMSVEHFDQVIVPILTTRLQQSELTRRSFDSRFYMPMLRSSTTLISSVYNFAPNAIEYGVGHAGHQAIAPNQPNLSRLSEQLDAQGKQIDDMRTLIQAQNNVIMNVSSVLNEVTKIIPAHSNNFTQMLQQMTSSAANLQGMLDPLTPPPTVSRQKPSDWLSKRIPKSPESPKTPKTLKSPTNTSRYELRSRQTSPGNSNTGGKSRKRKRI